MAVLRITYEYRSLGYDCVHIGYGVKRDAGLVSLLTKDFANIAMTQCKTSITSYGVHQHRASVQNTVLVRRT